jgi:hypothetical protein
VWGGDGGFRGLPITTLDLTAALTAPGQHVLALQARSEAAGAVTTAPRPRPTPLPPRRPCTRAARASFSSSSSPTLRVRRPLLSQTPRGWPSTATSTAGPGPPSTEAPPERLSCA